VYALTYTVDQSSHDVETRFESKLEWASLEFLIPRVGIPSDERRLKLETKQKLSFSGSMDFCSFFLRCFRCTTGISKKVTHTVGKKL